MKRRFKNNRFNCYSTIISVDVKIIKVTNNFYCDPLRRIARAKFSNPWNPVNLRLRRRLGVY